MKRLSLIQMVMLLKVCICVCGCVLQCVHVKRVRMYVYICVRRVCLCVRVSCNSSIFNDAFQMCYKFTCTYTKFTEYRIAGKFDGEFNLMV